MTDEELTKALQALAEELGGRLRIIGHNMHYVEIDAEHTLLIERIGKIGRIEFIASLVGKYNVVDCSGLKESWGEIEAWIRGTVNSIRSDQ